jgi:hypothetical protein
MKTVILNRITELLPLLGVSTAVACGAVLSADAPSLKSTSKRGAVRGEGHAMLYKPSMYKVGLAFCKVAVDFCKVISNLYKGLPNLHEVDVNFYKAIITFHKGGLTFYKGTVNFYKGGIGFCKGVLNLCKVDVNLYKGGAASESLLAFLNVFAIKSLVFHTFSLNHSNIYTVTGFSVCILKYNQ